MRQLVVDRAAQPVRNRVDLPQATRYAGYPLISPKNNRWPAYSTFTVVTGATDAPAGLTSYSRMTCAQIHNSLGFHIAENTEVGVPNALGLIPVVEGQRWTATYWVRSSVATTGGEFANNVRYASVTPGATTGTWLTGGIAFTTTNVSLSANVWTRVVATGIVPAGANGLGWICRYNLSLPVGATLDITGLGFYDGPDPGVTADGDSPGWRWLGTPKESNSVGYLWSLNPAIVRQQITNLVRNPRGRLLGAQTVPNFWNGSRVTAPASQPLTPSTDPDGTTFMRITAEFAESHSIIISTDGLVYPAGTAVTGLVRVRLSRAMNLRPRTSLLQQPGVPVAADTWTWVRWTTILTSATSIVLQPLLQGIDGVTVGMTMDISHAMAVLGTHPDLAYADGDVPGWAWIGTVHGSISTGFPYTLEQIAGSRLVSVQGFGRGALTLEQLPPLAGRTTYTVTDRTATGTATQAVLVDVVPSSTSQTGQIRVAADGRYEFRPQFVGGGGASAAYVSATTINPPAGARTIICAAQTEGLAQYDLEVNGGIGVGERVTRSGLVAGEGYNASAPGPLTRQASITSNGLYENPVFTIQFAGYHDQETRRRVTAWLARQYGAPIPTGY